MVGLCLGLCLFPGRGARADDVEVNVQRAALKGQGTPEVIVTLQAPVSALRLDLKRSDGGSVHLSSGRLGTGAQKIFEIRQPEGVFQYDGVLVARFPHGAPQTLPVQFEAAVLPPPRLTVPEKPVDLVSHSVAIVADRPIAELNVRVHADDGTIADDVTEKFPDSKPGDRLTVGWKQLENVTVLQIEIRATDRYGFFQNIDLFPWKIEIPHEDVLFETGKSDVLATEQPKLDAALAELNKAIEKYGRYAKVELFVAGYTDTVGDAASNRKLSEARALSIARDFRTHGVRIPISYTGFGEEQLLVPTPDETPEARNRRAAYIVSITAPPGAKWTRL
jgi:outer membrane protein OmpA-like peptidoglycan-associated protein